MRRRGTTLLFAVGMLAVMMMAAAELVTRTGERYHHAQLSRDRLQAIECARGGLLWARRRLDAGALALGTPVSVELGEAGYARVTVTEEGTGFRVAAEGVALRLGEPVATRRMEVLWRPLEIEP